MLPLFPLLPVSSIGGGPLQVYGAPPHLLYQAMHKGRALLIRGCPPLPLLVGVPASLTLLQAAHGKVTLPVGGGLLPLDLGVPTSLSCIPCTGSARCLGVPPLPPLGPGFPSSSSPACCLQGAHAADRGSPPLPPLPDWVLELHAAWLGWPPLSPAYAQVACTAGWGVPYPPPSPGCALGGPADMSWGPPLSPGCSL